MFFQKRNIPLSQMGGGGGREEPEAVGSPSGSGGCPSPERRGRQTTHTHTRAPRACGHSCGLPASRVLSALAGGLLWLLPKPRASSVPPVISFLPLLSINRTLHSGPISKEGSISAQSSGHGCPSCHLAEVFPAASDPAALGPTHPSPPAVAAGKLGALGSAGPAAHLGCGGSG